MGKKRITKINGKILTQGGNPGDLRSDELDVNVSTDGKISITDNKGGSITEQKIPLLSDSEKWIAKILFTMVDADYFQREIREDILYSDGRHSLMILLGPYDVSNVKIEVFNTDSNFNILNPAFANSIDITATSGDESHIGSVHYLQYSYTYIIEFLNIMKRTSILKINISDGGKPIEASYFGKSTI